MSLEQIRTENRRTAILRVLLGDPDYAVNCSLMQAALDHIGHGCSRDQVRSDFAWLAEQGLVTVEQVSDTIHVARLTGRGQDVAEGKITVPGVKRPRAD